MKISIELNLIDHVLNCHDLTNIVYVDDKRLSLVKNIYLN